MPIYIWKLPNVCIYPKPLYWYPASSTLRFIRHLKLTMLRNSTPKCPAFILSTHSPWRQKIQFSNDHDRIFLVQSNLTWTTKGFCIAFLSFGVTNAFKGLYKVVALKKKNSHMWIARRSTCRFPPGMEVGVGLDSSLVPGSPAMVSRLYKFIHQLCVLFVSVTRSVTDHCHLSVLLQPLIGKLTDAIPWGRFWVWYASVQILSVAISPLSAVYFLNLLSQSLFSNHTISLLLRKKENLNPCLPTKRSTWSNTTVLFSDSLSYAD